MFENIKWITGVNAFRKESIMFRKEFYLDNEVKNAEISLVVLGYGVCYINGKRITEDVLTTPFTRFDMRVLYNTYNVTSLLRKGKNVIGIYAGNGWYNDVAEAWNYEKATWKDMIKLICQMNIENTDGSTVAVVSDKSWKSTDGPSTYNHVREGEEYDARLEKDGWNDVDFDDSDWGGSVIMRAPGGVILPAKLPPVRIIREIGGVNIGNNIFDFGENISGWVKIKGSAASGEKVSMYYAEKLTPEKDDIYTDDINGFLNAYNRKLKNCDVYTFKGAEIEEWHPEFMYHGFRYVKVENMPRDFELTAQVVHTDLEIVGEFECSDEMLNKIHKATRRATLTNFVSIPTDCPHREQNGWTGDALWSAEQALMNYDMFTSYEKWLNDFKDVQRISGQLPGVIPTSSWGYNWGSGPSWDSALILIPWYVYQITGKKQIIENMWENMNRYMSYMDSMADGFIVGFGLPDWCKPETAVTCPGEVTDTAYYYVNARVMEKCSVLMGEDGEKYRKLAENIKKAYRDKFLNDPELEKSQTFLACGIYQGLYEGEEIKEKARKLADLVIADGYTIQCGTLGTKYIFRALSDNGYDDVLYKAVTNPNPPSYAYWINSGMTTLCENWMMHESQNHHMYSEVDMWFYRYIAGICIDEDGVKIEPQFIGKLDWVKAKHRDIEVSYNREKMIVKTDRKADVIVGGKTYHVGAGEHEFAI